MYPWHLQDSQDPNPLIRALAVRTMGCIRVDKITEYLCDPLQRCLKVSGHRQAAGSGLWQVQFTSHTHFGVHLFACHLRSLIHAAQSAHSARTSVQYRGNTQAQCAGQL